MVTVAARPGRLLRVAALVAVVAGASACEGTDASAPVETAPDDVGSLASASTLATDTPSTASAVDARCATAFTDTDRAAIQAAIAGSDLSASERTAHALNRFGYGDRSGASGVPSDPAATFASRILTSLKAGGSTSASVRAALDAALPRLSRPSGDLHYDFRKLYIDRDAARAAGNGSLAASLDAQITVMRDGILDELAMKQVIAAVLSPDIALGEIQTSFWLNHFNVDGRPVAIWTPSYEWTIRTNLCGTFEGMLKAVAHTPAMLAYLDNHTSTAPGKLHWSGSSGTNENYARELLELHTLGTGAKTATNTASPYTQADVERLALLLTGWSYTYAPDQHATSFKFFPTYHADGTHVVMGVTYADGEAGGNALLKTLANHASTKKFICTKLAGQFFASSVPTAVVDACISAWGTGGNLPRMIVRILARPETWAEANYANKIKNPLELVASAHRLSGDDEAVLTAARAKQAITAIRRMGVWLWHIDPPTGYSTRHLDWLDAGTMDEQLRYVYEQSAPAALSYASSSGTLKGSALETYFADRGTSDPAAALATIRGSVIPTRSLPFAASYDNAFLQTAFTAPDEAPGTSEPRRPVRTLLSFYASSWQFLLK